jgi:hypothetical protein
MRRCVYCREGRGSQDLRGTQHQGDGDEIALEVDTFYICIGCNQILGLPFLPCVILSDHYMAELLVSSKELVDWQTQFADIIRAAEDSSHAMVDAGVVECWKNHPRLPLRTPGCIMTKLLSSPVEDSDISTKARTPGIHALDTPEVDMNFSV